MATASPTLPAAHDELVVVRYPRVSLGGLTANSLLTLLGAAFFLPLLWLVFASVDRGADAGIRLPSLSGHNFASIATWEHLRPFWNSFYLAGLSTVVATLLALFAGYALSRRHVPFKRSLMLAILFTSGLPVTMLLVPTYQLFVRFNWINSLFWTSMFIAATSLPFAIWLLKNFIDQVPREFDEAAAIEGAGNLETLVRVVVPLALPGIIVTAMVSFINAWGAFVIPLVLDSNPQDTPASIATYQFMSANGMVMFGQLAAYSILFAVPVVLLYGLASRQLSGAFTLGGGLKG